MRKRKWALIAFIFMLAFIFFSLESWRLLQANDKLKEFILQEFRPIVGDQLHISKVHVSFGNIHILDVRFVNAKKDVSIDIRDLRIGYNFFNLLVRGFDPQYISQDALFIGPTITIRATPDSLNNTIKKNHNSVDSYAVFSPNFKEIHLFSHISIKDGEIVYAENDSVLTRIVRSVQGGIYREKNDSLFIHLDGAFYNSATQNIQIKGYGDFKTQRVSRIFATLTDYQLEHGMPIIPENILKLANGTLHGDLEIFWQKDRNRYTASGTLDVQDAAATILGGKLVVTESFSSLSLKDDKILIRESTQFVNDSPVSITGSLEHFTNSLLDLYVESPQFKPGKFSSLFPSNMPKISGTTQLYGSIRGPLDQLEINSQVRSRSIKLDDIFLKNFYSDAMFNGDILRIDSCTADVFENRIALNGLVELSSSEHRILGRISASGQGEPLISALKLDSTVAVQTNFAGVISGTLTQPVVEGHVNLDIRSETADSLFIEADVQYRDKMLTLGTEPLLNGFFVNSFIDWRSSPPAIDAVCQQPEQLLFYLRDLPVEKYITDHLRSSIAISGNLKQFVLNGNILKMAGGLVDEPLLGINATLKRTAGSLETDGTFILYPSSFSPTRGEFAFEKNDAALHISRLAIEDQMTSSLTIDFKQDNAMNGRFVANGFDITRLIVQQDSALAGLVDLDINIAGHLSVPQLDGYVHAHNLLYNEVGPYESLLSFNVDSSKIDLHRFLLNFGKSTLLFAQGNYDFKNDDLDFNIKGAGFDAAHLLGAAGQDSIFTGKMLVDVHIDGPAKTPDVRGVLGIKNGALANIPFDEVELKLGADSNLIVQRPPSLFIDKFRLSRFNTYELLAAGSYPFDASDSLYLDIDGEGNFLQILNDVSPFFQTAYSSCSLKSRIRGTPGKLRLQAADLTVEKAGLDFKSVVSTVTDLRAEITFDPNEQFLHLVSLEGNMGTKPFRIRNELASNVTSARPLQNIHIGESDFHFGVLVLETPEKGVPLNFVGLMEPGKFGTIDLLGREENEHFYFGATSDALTLRGRLNLYDTEVMYPFYEVARPQAPKVRDFLRSLKWDIFVVPVKNTRFVRNFPGAIDEVYVDLKIDENFGGLEITDQLVNETFRINGHIRSTKGFIDYLDMNFRVEQFGVDFDRSSLIPVAYGTAKTTVTDSLGISSNIVLTLQTVDNTMDKKSVDDIVRQEEGRARFNQIRFKLSSDNPNIGSTEAQVLASLGYSANNLQGSAIAAIGSGTDNLLFRPLFRPVERELEQALGLDYVRFSSQLTKNIILFNLNNNIELNNRLALLESTKIIVGKYLADRFFLQYTGQLESGVGYRYKEKHLGLHHTIGLEYQLAPQVLVELEYDYDSLMLKGKNRDDKRIVLRHWFPF